MLSDGSFELELRQPIEVAGVEDKVTTLVFHECGEGYDRYYLKMRMFVNSAKISAARKFKGLHDDPEDPEDPEGIESGVVLKPVHLTSDEQHEKDVEEKLSFLNISLSISSDMEDIIKVFGNMVCKSGGSTPICTAGGTRLREGAWNRVHPEDKVDAVVKYCAFFGIGLDKTSTNKPVHASASLTEVKEL